MRIYRPELIEQGEFAEHRVRVVSEAGDRELYFRVPSRFGNCLSESGDASLLGLLLPAMQRGDDIRVDGPVSACLLHHLEGPYQRLLQGVIPSLCRVRIVAEDVPNANSVARAPGVLMGFSGGIDSFSALADHFYCAPRPEFRVTHLLFNNVGSHGVGAWGERIFHQRYSHLAPFADRLGLPFVKLNSNLDEFFGPGLGFEQTNTPRNLAAALVLQRGCGRYLYASAFSFQQSHLNVADDTSFSDPVAVPMLSTERMSTHSVGGQYNRIQKIMQVAELPDSYSLLDVCMDPRETTNCSNCIKCMRTLLTLDIAGLLDRYSECFDLDGYRRRKNRFLGSILRPTTNPLILEIAQFARDRQFPVPLESQAFRYLHGPVTQVRRVVTSVKRLVRKNSPG